MTVRTLGIGGLAILLGWLAPAVALAAHDSVVLQMRPKAIKIRAGVADVHPTARVTVRNADVLPIHEVPGHMIQLLASDGDCPPGTVDGLPDFSGRTPGPQDSILVKGGSTKTATVPLHITSSALSAFNPKTPTRCTLRLRVVTVGDDSDPTPSNNTAFLVLNVVDANTDGSVNGPEVVLNSVGASVVTLHPLTITTKKRQVSAKNAHVGMTGTATVTVTGRDNTCPTGVVGAFDFDSKTANAQPSFIIKDGKSKGGVQALTIDPAAFPPATKQAPFRCSVDLGVAGAGGDTDATNNHVRIVLDVIGGTAVLPALTASDPVDAATGVVRTRWLRLQFGAAVDPITTGAFALSCDGEPQSFTSTLLDPTTLIINPTGSLPAGAACVLAWQTSGGPVRLSFSTAAAGAAASVVYDRTDNTHPAPYPDDFWLTPDGSTVTGVRVAMAVPDMDVDEQNLFIALLNEANQIDGFSLIGHFLIDASDAIDPASIPTTREAAVDPLATIGLFDLTPGSPTLGERIPFRIDVRNDTNQNDITSHTLLLFPSIPLSPRGHYGFVITRGALVDATRPLEPSAFFAAALADPTPGEAAAVTRVRSLATDVLDRIAANAALPIPADDVALVLSISVRSTDSLPNELMAMRQQIRSMAAPAIVINTVTAETQAGSHVAAFVKGTWQAPEFRNGVDLNRDSNGLPLLVTTHPINFTLALPNAALSGPVPITMYQHGSPGDAATEVPKIARREMAAAGFALMGFRDVLNREVSPNATTTVQAATLQVLAILQGLQNNLKIPDYWIQTNAEQLAFVRALESLGTLDVLPIGAPDGIPEIDVTQPLTYFGISEGSVHAPGLLAYEPDIRAAALVVGGARAVETIIHQQPDAALGGVSLFFPNLTGADTWVGFGLFQADFDRQDTHNQAPFIYRNPLVIDGTTQRASILMTEGLTDSLIPNNATDSLAWTLGPLPHLLPAWNPVPFLTQVVGPVTANINATTSAAFYQYVPAGVPGVPVTPGCEAQPEGHYCAQTAPVTSAQRTAFFQSAIANPAPTIINPLP